MQGGHSSNQTQSKFEDATSVAKACATLLKQLLIKEKEAFWKNGNQAPMSSIKKELNMDNQTWAD